MPDSRERHRTRTHQERAGESCPQCGRSFDTVDRVDVHHADGNPSNGSPDNLRKRCKRCHLEGEHGRAPEQEQSPAPGYTGPPAPRASGPR